MRLIITVVLVVLGVETTAAQTVRCQLSPRPYGLGGTCQLDVPQTRPEGAPRIPFASVWPATGVSIVMSAGPSERGPWRGNISFPRLETSFEIAREETSPTQSRVVFRTGIFWLLVREWRDLAPATEACSACDRSAKVVSLVFDLTEHPTASEDDKVILRRALSNLKAMKSWDREEGQNCANTERGNQGLFCLLYTAIEARMGRYHHRQPALELVRAVIMERWPERVTGHPLIDFNNHSGTKIDDLRAVLELSLARADAQAQSAK